MGVNAPIDTGASLRAIAHTVPPPAAIAPIFPMPRAPARIYRWVVLVGLVGATVSLLLGKWFRQGAAQADEARFLQISNAAGIALEQRVEAIEALLRNLARNLSAKPAPELADWDELMNQESPPWNHPGVLALGYATNAAAGDTVARLQRWIADHPEPAARDAFYRPAEEFTGAKAWVPWVLEVYHGELRPSASFASAQLLTNRLGEPTLRRYREAVAPMEQKTNRLVPMTMNRRTRVYEDLPDTEPLLHAIYRDEVKITGFQPGLRRTNGPAPRAATLLAPTYHPRRAKFWRLLPPTDDWTFDRYWLRWNLNQGFVFAHLDFARLLGLAQGAGPHAVRVEIYSVDTNRVSEATWMNPDGQARRAGTDGFQPSFQFTHSWPMYGDRWTLFFHTTPLFDSQSTRYRAAWATGSGLLATALVCWALAVQLRGRWQDQQRTAELLEARDALQAIQQHRERLSADLHDGAIQSLYAVQLGLTETAREVKALSATSATRLRDSREALDGVLAELRRFVGPMVSPGGQEESASLALALAALVSQFRPATAALIELACGVGAGARLAPTQAVQLANIARNALSNCVRHGNARRICVRLRDESTAVALEVEDDGRGFEPSSVAAGGLGLPAMHRRARELGGTLNIASAPGMGTCVTVLVPVLPQPPLETA